MSNVPSASNSHVRAVSEGAVMIALAEILSFLPLYRMPWGGSVKLAMLPIVVYCVRWGFGRGMIAAVAHAVLQTVFDGGVAIGWQSIIGDYLLAYSVVGVAGVFRGQFYAASIAACTLRFLVHYVVGATVWAEYMPERFFGMTMHTPWFYSALYNAAYMLPILLAMLLVGWLLMRTPARKYLLAEDLM